LPFDPNRLGIRLFASAFGREIAAVGYRALAVQQHMKRETFRMKNTALRWVVRDLAILSVATGLGGSTLALAGDPEESQPVHYSGLINDYTASAATIKGGPYEMRGRWSLDVDQRHGTARFSAALNMEVSDYGITQGSVNKDDPTTRNAHTHHILMNGTVSSDWSTSCPQFNPAPVSGGFVVTGPATITGNGGPPPFGSSAMLTVCVLGAANVEFANLTMQFGAPANTHFGTQWIHGVVSGCEGHWERESKDCSVQAAE
jgi:hypothetical protein